MLNKNYFKYLFQNKKIAWIFFLVMYMAVSLSSFISLGTTYSAKLNFAFKCSFVLSCIMTFVLPIFLFSFVHRKRSCDLYFSLPIERKELLSTTILFSFTLTFGFFILTTLVAILLCMSHITINLIAYLQTILFVGFSSLALLLINSSIYLLANNIFDGILMLAAYLVIPVSICIVLSVISNVFLIDFLVNKINGGIYFSPIAIVWTNASVLMSDIVHSADTIAYFEPFSNVYVILLFIYTIISSYLLKKNFVDRKTERAEQISDTFLSYPFIINYYLLVSLIILGLTCTEEGINDGYVILYILLYFVYIVALFIYKRKIKFYWKNTFYYIAVMVLALGIGEIIFINKGFGLPYTYSLSTGDTLVCNISEYDLNTSLALDTDSSSTTSVSLDITINIPTDELESDTYKEAVSILEDKRNQAIDAWFEKRYYEDATCTITFNSTSDNSTLLYGPTYQTSNLFTLDELKTLSKCGTINISVYDYESGIDNSYSLTEYLKAVQNDFE